MRIQSHETSKWIAIDAHHFNPATMAQIHQAGSVYFTQAKENQALFLQQCKLLLTQFLPLAETAGYEKAHGRVTARRAQLFSFLVNPGFTPEKQRFVDSDRCGARNLRETAKQKPVLK